MQSLVQASKFQLVMQPLLGLLCVFALILSKMHLWDNHLLFLSLCQTQDYRTHVKLKLFFSLTVHSKNIAGLRPMAWWFSLPTLYEGWQTGSPLVPCKLPRLLPHKSRVPGRSRDAPSWTQRLTLQVLAPQAGRVARVPNTQPVLVWSVCDTVHWYWLVLFHFALDNHALMEPEICIVQRMKSLGYLLKKQKHNKLVADSL